MQYAYALTQVSQVSYIRHTDKEPKPEVYEAAKAPDTKPAWVRHAYSFRSLENYHALMKSCTLTPIGCIC